MKLNSLSISLNKCLASSNYAKEGSELLSISQLK